jgi:hypothetical protein
MGKQTSWKSAAATRSSQLQEIEVLAVRARKWGSLIFSANGTFRKRGIDNS